MATYYRSSWRHVEDLHSRTRTAVVVVNSSRACTRGDKRENYSSHCLLRIAVVIQLIGTRQRPWQFKSFQYALICMRHESQTILLYAFRAYDRYPVVLVMYFLSGVRIIHRGLLFSIVFSYPGHAGTLNIGAFSK